MKVFIEELGEWFDATKSPILLLLSNQEKKKIGNMPPEHERFLQCPVGTSQIKMNQLINMPPPLDDTTGLNGTDIQDITPLDDD